MDLDKILKKLKRLGKPEVIQTKQKFGIYVKDSYGIFLKDLKMFAKEIPKDDLLAKALFDTGVYEARLLVPMIFNPDNLTSKLMDEWADSFNTWEICDTYCMGFFGLSHFAYEKAFKWVKKRGEYQKRAGFVCIVAYAFTNKTASNEAFKAFFPELIQYSNDGRVYVMKSINWALRQIGKRNRDLHRDAIILAKLFCTMESDSAQWIGKDALRQLQQESVHMKNYPRSLYG